MKRLMVMRAKEGLIERGEEIKVRREGKISGVLKIGGRSGKWCKCM